MKTGIDLKVRRKEEFGGLYDINIVDGQIDLVDNFDTALQMSVFCERRADGSEVLPSFQRRGWWGNTISNRVNFEIGSKIWILAQSRLTQDVINKIAIYAKEATDWLVEDGYLEKIDIDVTQRGDTAVRINFKLFRSNSEVESLFFDLWNNTQSFDPRSL
jgi:phage gp46-like protein